LGFFQDHRGGQLHLAVVDHPLHPGGGAVITNVAVNHKHREFGVDLEHIFHAMLDNDDRLALVGQAPDEGQSFFGAGRVQAGERLVKQ
jgi:hypothetical protein